MITGIRDYRMSKLEAIDLDIIHIPHSDSSNVNWTLRKYAIQELFIFNMFFESDLKTQQSTWDGLF